jgi:hypothetical protein
MEENAETPRPSRSWRPILLSWLEKLKIIFLCALAIAALVGASFLFTGGLTARAYSDRLFMVGVIVTFIGVFIFITVGGTRKNMGIPAIAKNPDEARKIMEHTLEMSAKADKRYDAGSYVWVIGIACLVLSVLIYFLLTVFGI